MSSLSAWFLLTQHSFLIIKGIKIPTTVEPGTVLGCLKSAGLSIVPKLSHMDSSNPTLKKGKLRQSEVSGGDMLDTNCS